MTLQEALRLGVERLTDFGTDSPYLDALVLLAEANQLTKEKLYSRMHDPAGNEALGRYFTFLEQRTSGIPVSYIRKKKEFYGREFYVDNRVLVPRPDTEIVVDAVLEVCGKLQNERETAGGSREAGPLRLLDLCTGSGCIAITVAAEAAERGLKVEVTGSDVSRKALEVFELNAEEILGRPLSYIESDLFENITGKYDVIVSNPPYLTEEEMSSLEIRRWPEPKRALNGGIDGLRLIREVIKKGVEYLEGNGYLLLEASPDQMDRIESIMKKESFQKVYRKKDLGNRDRTIIASK